MTKGKGLGGGVSWVAVGDKVETNGGRYAFNVVTKKTILYKGYSAKKFFKI